MLKKANFVGCIIPLILLAVFESHAQIIFTDVPRLINYQAYLTDASGNPINGDVDIQFSIYTTVGGGNPLWTETQTVTVTDGLFNVFLGSINTLDYSVFNSPFRYLALKVGDDPEMTPRKQLVSVGFAYRANSADKLKGKKASDFVQTVDSVSPKDGDVDLVAGENVTITPDTENNRITISATGGGVGPGGDDLNVQTLTASGHIKTGSPTSSYDVGDIVSVDDVIADDDVVAGGSVTANNNSGGNTGYIGGSSGVYGKHNNGNMGYLGNSSYGVFGRQGSEGNWGYLGGARGAAGVHSASGNNGYLGSSYYGAWGKHQSSQNEGYLGGGGYGAYGKQSGSENYGYLGSSDYGTYGKHHASGNFGYVGGPLQGIYGSSHVDNGRGVEGFSSKAEGVFGFSQDFHGVHGLSRDTYGVYGRNLNGNFGALGGSDCGVYGNSSAGLAGSFEGDVKINGDVEITGNLRKSYSGNSEPLSRVLPIAYAHISKDGTVASGTSNVSSSWNSESKWYQITIDGVGYTNNYVTIATRSLILPYDKDQYTKPFSLDAYGFAGILIVVICYDGERRQGSFNFVTYDSH